ncbi:hypothetical protein K3495_g9460 [Podosphaera aphanis]|nr:hypothetical protein K3495_g9460 [Podosphaera aphanis]
MPPPITPSPHRFVISKNRPVIPARQPQTPANTQFKTTPRFSRSSQTPQSTLRNEYVEVTSLAPRYVNLSSQVLKEHDIIDTELDIPSCHRDGNVNNGSLGCKEILKDKRYKNLLIEEPIEESIDEPSPKRRKQSPSPSPSPGLLDQNDEDASEDMLSIKRAHDLPSSPYEILSSPELKKTASIRAPRFIISTQNPSSSPRTPNFIKPPLFRPPDPEDSEKSQFNHLPEEFPCHKKSQEYVPGGLAAVLRDWLVTINSTSTTTTTTRRPEMRDSWIIKILVDEFSGDITMGLTLIHGSLIQQQENDPSDDLTEVKVALAGEGSGIGLQKSCAVAKGSIVGIKGPFWKIIIKNEKWIVGVDWKVLS